MWSQAHQLITHRGNGDPIPGADVPLSFSIDSYVTGEYPPGREVRHLVDGVDVTDTDVARPDSE